jgi:hypothetical protein
MALLGSEDALDISLGLRAWIFIHPHVLLR